MTGDATFAMHDFRILYLNSSIIETTKLRIIFITVKKLLCHYSYTENDLYLIFRTFSMWTIFLDNTLL